MRMYFAKEDCTSDLIVRAYEPGRITIGEQSYENSLILTRDRLFTDWRPRDFTELNAEDLDSLQAMNPEIILLGTGPALRFPQAAITAGLLQAGIGVEVMDTAAACRTYNILLAEERQVVAALLLV